MASPNIHPPKTKPENQMKISVLVFAFLASLLASCNSKQADPSPMETTATSGHTVSSGGDVSASATANSTYMEFRLFDAADGDQFNAALNARIYYFPGNYTDAQINTAMGSPDTNPNWEPTLAPTEEFDFDNVVAPVYGWSAQPGFIHLDFAERQPGERIAIRWLFTEANPNCRRGYREQVFIWNGLGENYTLKTDQFRAGL